MANTEQHSIPVARDSKTEWLSENPVDLAEIIAIEYGPEDRTRLANVALEAALNEHDDKYGRHNPWVRAIAKSALQMGLGLKPLPEQGEI
jgi:hypothetical protein